MQSLLDAAVAYFRGALEEIGDSENLAALFSCEVNVFCRLGSMMKIRLENASLHIESLSSYCIFLMHKYFHQKTWKQDTLKDITNSFSYFHCG